MRLTGMVIGTIHLAGAYFIGSLVISITRGSAHQSFDTLIHLSFEAPSLFLYYHGFRKGITRPHSLSEEEHECANF